MRSPTGRTPAPDSSAPPCRHCKQRLAYRPRGLCAHCYFVSAVRALYPPDQAEGSDSGSDVGKAYRSPVGRRAARNLAARPTSARPGTPEKVEVLADRARQGVSLWHPLDACQSPRSNDLR